MLSLLRYKGHSSIKLSKLPLTLLKLYRIYFKLYPLLVDNQTMATSIQNKANNY